ncbi:MAG: chemotaxis protein CheW [Akkermansiaceae bacterium]|nr:chemotaxis protein CheW [Akkermansiaceae bacterium]NNM30094.1 chemotaxis protein CheW [Akkermansiaceae bacterium]
MRQRRYLAPWHRKVLEGNELTLEGEEAAAALEALHGKPAIYHCTSRIVDRQRLLGGDEKEQFVRLMRRYEAFSQVQVITHCVMSNHFHILVEVPAPPEDGGASWSDERLLKHLGLIYDEARVGQLRWELAQLRGLGDEEAADAFRARFFARMWDLSAFMKILKQSFTQWFNRTHGRRGVLWEERFKSELVESGHATRRVAGYIDLNPVRAGIVSDPKDYRWSGYGEAVAGKKRACVGLRLVLFEELCTRTSEGRAARELAGSKEVMRRYRLLLFEEGEASPRDETRKRAGIPRKRVEQILARGGDLSEAELMWCRTRYFVDGLVLGSEAFVNRVFALSRGYFGPKRVSGARRMRQVASQLCTMRDLRKEALRC